MRKHWRIVAVLLIGSVGLGLIWTWRPSLGRWSGSKPTADSPRTAEPLRLAEGDKLEGVRHVVAWVAQGTPLPGFAEPYADATLMKQMKWFVVTCDFVSKDVSLCPDPRVVRELPPGARNADESGSQGYVGGTALLTITSTAEADRRVTFLVNNHFGPKAEHGYQFIMTRTPTGLQFKGELRVVS